MLKFGNKENPFDPSELPDELAYTRKFFSKKPNDHIVQLLEFLSSNYKAGLNKVEVDKQHSLFDYKIVLNNITAIYNNYKCYLVDNYSSENLRILFDLKSCFTDYEVAENVELNLQIINQFTDSLLSDLIIEDAEIEIKNNTLIWYNGIFLSGQWIFGIFKNGKFYGNFINGIWEGGQFNGTGKISS